MSQAFHLLNRTRATNTYNPPYEINIAYNEEYIPINYVLNSKFGKGISLKNNFPATSSYWSEIAHWLLNRCNIQQKDFTYRRSDTSQLFSVKKLHLMARDQQGDLPYTLFCIIIRKGNIEEFCFNFTYGRPIEHLIEVHVKNSFNKNNYKALFEHVNNKIFKPLSWVKFVYVNDFKHIYKQPPKITGDTLSEKIKNTKEYGNFTANKLSSKYC